MVRSARTPPPTFLFLLFSFQTARRRCANIHPVNSVSGTCKPTGRQLATDDRSAANSLISMRSFRDENARQCQRPWRRRVNGWVYMPAPRRLSTSESTNCRIRIASAVMRGTVPIFERNAVLEPQCYDVLAQSYVMFRAPQARSRAFLLHRANG